MPAHRSHGRTKTEPWDGDIQDLPCIGSGTSGLTFQIDPDRVVKVSLGTARSIEDIETERRIYERFQKEAPDCPQILCCLEPRNPRGLVFECCQGTVRGRLRSQSSVPVGLVIKWARQAAGGLAIIHKCGVIQGDVGCHNMLLDANDNLKLADFAGSTIDGLYATDATVNYEVRSRLPGIDKPTKKSDIFALGSALYELVTGSPPYAHESSRNIQIWYKKEIYEDVSRLPLPDFGPIIAKCWRRGYNDAKEVVRALEEVASRTKHETPQPNALIENFSQLEIAPQQWGQDQNADVQQRPSQLHNTSERVAGTGRRKKRKQKPKWVNRIKHWLIPPQMRYQRGINCY